MWSAGLAKVRAWGRLPQDVTITTGAGHSEGGHRSPHLASALWLAADHRAGPGVCLQLGLMGLSHLDGGQSHGHTEGLG